MSEFRICFGGKGIGEAVEVEQEDKYSHIFAGNSDIYAWRVEKSDDMLCFEISHNFGCSDYFDFFKYELARSLPDTTINYYWHSTMSDMSGSYNIGFVDGRFVTWDDDEVYAYCAYRIKHKDIVSILKCEETDTAGFTHVLVNGKEFWLNGLRIENDSIWFNNGEKGYRKYTGIEEEITKAVPDREVIVESEDFITGQVNIYRATYKNGEFHEEFLGWKE